jgi:hypothetical protein
MTKPTMEKFRVPPSLCPYCGHFVDGASLAGGNEADDADHKPKPDDLCVCIKCVGMSRYGKDMQLVALTKQEYEELPAEIKHDLARARAAVGVAAVLYPELRPK